MSWLSFARRRETAEPAPALAPLSYEECKTLARAPEVEVRRGLARRQDLRPEILYFLAEDSSALVRREVAANPRTPAQADLVLAADVDDDVRADLARKIARLAPEAAPTVQAHMRELTFKVMHALAHDHLPRVRAIVAEEVKRASGVPRDMVLSLARDAELMVSAPVLEFSPLLSDADLIEIIESTPLKGALSCIARRVDVGGAVADAIVETRDVEAVATLLANDSAQIREETLDRIIDEAPEIEPWHRPLAERPDLSPRAVQRIAGFVGSALIVSLAERHGLDPDDLREVAQAVQKRLRGDGEEDGEDAAERARAAIDAGRFDDDGVQAAIDSNDRSFVAHGLAQATGLPVVGVNRVLRSKSPRAVTALAWKAGLNMRSALQLQLRVARIPGTQVLNARNGVHFPLSEEEMDFALEIFRS